MNELKRRARLSQHERNELKADEYAQKPEKEVKVAFKLPGPLSYKPPLDSEWVIAERAREGKEKAQRQTLLAQEKAQKRSDALSEAAMRGFNVREIAAGRQVNWNGIYCTQSSRPTDKCVQLGNAQAAIKCNAEIQECEFKHPKTGKMEIVEPPIFCRNGQTECDQGVAKQETTRWLRKKKLQERLMWKEAVEKSKEDRKVYNLKEQFFHGRVNEAKTYAKAEMKERLTKVEITANRPNGVFNPMPKLTYKDHLGEARARTMQMRQRLGAVNKLLQKLGVLTSGCQEPKKRCLKQCSDPGRLGQRNDPDGSICRQKCTEDIKYCMLKKIKLAKKSALEFEARQQMLNATNATADAKGKAAQAKAAAGEPKVYSGA